MYFSFSIQPGSSNNSTAARPARQRPTQPYNPGTDRPTEEQERITENNDVKVREPKGTGISTKLYVRINDPIMLCFVV